MDRALVIEIKKWKMTQEERWLTNYDEVMRFVKTYCRNLSKYELSERRLYTWMKHNRKQMNAELLKEPRFNMFKELLALSEEYRRKNQYQ